MRNSQRTCLVSRWLVMAAILLTTVGGPTVHRRPVWGAANLQSEGHGIPRAGGQTAVTKTTFMLAGDSTVADQSGWGKGFQQLLSDRAACHNLAKGGRSSRSFRAEGWWQQCLEAQPDYLLIQFGHNDQPGKGPERESAADTEFREHLRQFVRESRAAGIKPVLVTPLTRRRWNPDGTIMPTLAEYAEATAVVASELDVPLIDLHRLSISQCETIGPTAFRAFEPMTLDGADHTHLNTEGGMAVAQLVAADLIRILPELEVCFSPAALHAAARPTPHDAKVVNGPLVLLETEQSLTVTRDDAVVLQYRKVSPPVPTGLNPAYHRSGILHPVMSPQGTAVTAMFPVDHPHQHGVFTAWVKTTWNERDIDFWNLAGGTGRVLHQRVVSSFRDDDTVGFEVDLVHRAEQAPVVDVLRERWRVTVRPTDGSFHCFDLHTTQTALTAQPLHIHQYHYGGVSIRGPVGWLVDANNQPNQNQPGALTSRITNNLRSERIDGNHEHAKWVAMTGSSGNARASVAVLCHADNFRAPQAARLHPTKPYFVYAPCADGAFVIDRDTPYRGKYRYLVTDTEPDAEWLDRKWKEWHSE
jgi:lysophospholipase L1-like esterase